jgi:hypothetical protein
MDILSTLKGEYSRTLILILIPGGIALLPIADIFYVLFFKDQKEYIGYFSVLVFLSSIFYGFISQDLGARIEIFLDCIYCIVHRSNRGNFKYKFTNITDFVCLPALHLHPDSV